MGYVVSLHDFRPGARYDGVPWTEGRIEEAPEKAGSYEQIDVLALDPVDTDPTFPQTRNFTTDEATLPAGWYRVIFADANGATQQSDPVYFPGTGVASSLSLAEFKEHVDRQLDAEDELLERYLAGAFLQAQAPPPNGCGRLLTPDPPAGSPDPVARSVRVAGRRTVRVPDAREITAVVADDQTLEVGDWEVVLERDGLIVRIDLARACNVCEITGHFGFAEIPQNLKNGIYVLAARAAHERDAAYADQVAIAEGAGVQTYYRQLPPAVKLAFATYSLATGHISLP